MATITDINLETRALCDADSTSYPDAMLLRRTNDAYEQIIGALIGNDGRWQFDDSNYTDLPIGVTNLVSGQQDYTFDSRFLNVERAEVLDNNGTWHELIPLDITDIQGALSEYEKTNALPKYYDKRGESILLYPIPATANVTLVNGLKVYYQRTAAIFNSTEVTAGTKSPGFASPWHYLISYMAALPYCLTYKKDRVVTYERKITAMTESLLEFYSLRNKDEPVRFGIRTESNR